MSNLAGNKSKASGPKLGFVLALTLIVISFFAGILFFFGKNLRIIVNCAQPKEEIEQREGMLRNATAPVPPGYRVRHRSMPVYNGPNVFMQKNGR